LPWLAVAVFIVSFKPLIEAICVISLVLPRVMNAVTAWERYIAHAVVSYRRRRRPSCGWKRELLSKAIGKTQE
jgi:hypothetical protein